MLRIGIVTQSYYPVRGGVSEHVHHQGMELLRRGHDVTIVTGATRSTDVPEITEVEEWRANGGHLVRVGRTHEVSFNGATVSLVLEPGLAQGLYPHPRDAFDVLHVHSPFEPLLPIAALQYFTAPAVATFHSAGTGGRLYRLLRPILSPLANRLTARVAVSSAARDHVAEVFPGNYEIIPNGVDTGLFGAEAVGNGNSLPRTLDSRPCLLLVGRLDSRKGHECVLRALAERPGLDVHLRIVGDGPLRARLEEVAATCGGRVHFTGALEREALRHEYEAADLFLAPATHGESFGVVLLEAMAAGLPILASSTSAYRAVMDECEAAAWAEPGRPESWSAALEGLVRRRPEWPTMGRAGQRYVEAFHWTNVVDSLEGVYERALFPVRAPGIKRPRYSPMREDPGGHPSLVWTAPSRSVREPAARK